jgi:hypothetical protein
VPEGVWPDGPLAGGDRLLVEPQGLPAGAGVLGQQDVGVGTVGPDREGLPGQLGLPVAVLLRERPERSSWAWRDGVSPLTLREIGERLGLTKERVRQIERRALARLGGRVPAV